MKRQETIFNGKKQYEMARNNMHAMARNIMQRPETICYSKKQYATARNNMKRQETI